MTVGNTYRFDQIFQEEVQAINVRRRELGRTDFVALEVEIDEAFAPAGELNSKQSSEARSLSLSSESTTRGQKNTRPEREPVLRPTASSNVVGLALSGGGIRSASFCLGALQALDKADVLKNIDYLSTVSGGGYIGTSLSAAMTHSKGEFPFESSLTQDERYPVQHIRNHSNYLFPRGSINFFYNIVIYLRGLLAAVAAARCHYHDLPQTDFRKLAGRALWPQRDAEIPVCICIVVAYLGSLALLGN